MPSLFVAIDSIILPVPPLFVQEANVTDMEPSGTSPELYNPSPFVGESSHTNPWMEPNAATAFGVGWFVGFLVGWLVIGDLVGWLIGS